MKFLICKYNCNTKNNVVIDVHTDKTNAVNSLFEIAVNYIKEKDGANIMGDINNRVVNKKEMNILNLCPGHYMIRDQQNDHFYKLEIWQKTTSYTKYYGIAKLKNHHWQHIFDLDIVEIISEVQRKDEPKPPELKALAKKLHEHFNKLQIQSIIKENADSRLYTSVSYLKTMYLFEFNS